MYDLLVRAAEDWPVEGNKDGSYLTFRSKSAVIFMVPSFDDLPKLSSTLIPGLLVFPAPLLPLSKDHQSRR